jgi:20S proteasome alpha/beta subunit
MKKTDAREIAKQILRDAMESAFYKSADDLDLSEEYRQMVFVEAEEIFNKLQKTALKPRAEKKEKA